MKARNIAVLLFRSNQGAAAVIQTVIARFFTVAINLATGVINARGLGAVGRGEMSVLVLWPGLLASLLTLGMPAAIRYWVRRDPARQREFFTVALGVSAVMSIITVAIGFFFVPSWLHNYSPQIVREAQILMFMALVLLPSLVLSAMLEGIQDFRSANVTRYIPPAITLVALCVLVSNHSLTPFMSALAYMLPVVPVAAWKFWKLRKNYKCSSFDRWPPLQLLGSYGIRSYGIDVLSTLGGQIDQVLVIALLSASNVGVYVVALNASRVLTLLTASVVTVLLPSASGLDKEGAVEIVTRSARISTAIAATLGLALVAVYPVIFPLFYGRAFSQAVSVAQLLTLEAVLFGAVDVLAQAFMALGRPGFVTALQSIGLMIVFPAMLLFLPHFGLLGAAMALLTSTTVRLIFVLWSYPMFLKIPMPNLILRKDDFVRVRRLFFRL